jgi:cytidylate kinase
MPKVITIAREYGSGGRLIAKMVSEKLGIKFYDNQIIDMVAEDLGFDIRAVRKAMQERSSGFIYSMVGGTMGGSMQMPLTDRVFNTQSRVIRHLAAQEDCIIVNGCADYILEDYDNVLKVFIHAPLESRMRRVSEDYHEAEGEDLKKAVLHKDKGRQSYYNYYTANKWGNLKNFDLTINSDYGLEEVADILVEFYKKLK